MCVCVCIYIYIERERERETDRQTDRQRDRDVCVCVCARHGGRKTLANRIVLVGKNLARTKAILQCLRVGKLNLTGEFTIIIKKKEDF